MTQIISQPTRENNILDLVFVTDPDLVCEEKVGEILSGCDHNLIRFSIRTDHELLEKRFQTTEKPISVLLVNCYLNQPGRA